MNLRLILYIMGQIMRVEGLLMLLPFACSLIYREDSWYALLIPIALLLALGTLLTLRRPASRDRMGVRDGLFVVGTSWVVLSLFGMLPFILCGAIPHPVDAFFETVSGFTTTGATVLGDVVGTLPEDLDRGIALWRALTHWIGGMGVLVLTLALLPQMSGRTSHLVRAESPGPTLSKIVPRMGDTAKLLYLIYGTLTVGNFLALLPSGMSLYDAAIHALGTAGTGGFSNYSASVGHFASPWVNGVTTVFMLIFGVNFALYYKIMIGDWKDALKCEELHWFLGIFAGATMLITLSILPEYGNNIFDALQHSAFQVASIMSTTGYATADFNLWPIAARMLILALLFTGACAGSTAGGMKICRIGMMWKQGAREVRRTIQPRKVQLVRFEGKAVEEETLHQVAVFTFVYILFIVLGGALLSLEGRFDVQTNFTAALTCVSNVGPGLGAVGPAGSFAGYGPFGKLLMSFLMLAGRLEFFPMLALFHPAMWRK